MFGESSSLSSVAAAALARPHVISRLIRKSFWNADRIGGGLEESLRNP
jgi:hypothetical protein